MEPNKCSSVVGDGSEYLCMTNSHATTSPLSSNGREDSSQLDFNFSPKSHKGREEEAVDSLEMCPMLNNPTQAFSNPNYKSHMGLKQSDSENAYAQLNPSKLTAPSSSHYINTPGPIESEVNEEAHYVVPKNNSSVV